MLSLLLRLNPASSCQLHSEPFHQLVLSVWRTSQSIHVFMWNQHRNVGETVLLSQFTWKGNISQDPQHTTRTLRNWNIHGAHSVGPTLIGCTENFRVISGVEVPHCHLLVDVLYCNFTLLLLTNTVFLNDRYDLADNKDQNSRLWWYFRFICSDFFYFNISSPRVMLGLALLRLEAAPAWFWSVCVLRKEKVFQSVW